MPISPYYKPINQIRSEVDADNAQNYGLGLDPSLGAPPAPTSQYDLGVDPSLGASSSPVAPADDVTSHQSPPPPPMDDNQILQKYMRQKYPEAFSKGQGQVADNQVTRQDIDNLQNNSDLDTITSAFSKAAAGAGSVGGVAAKSNYEELAKQGQTADANALKNRMELTNQGEDLQQNAIKGLTALDTQNYQSSLRPLELQAKQQGLDQGAANLEKTNLGIQGAQMDFRSKQSLQDPDSPESKALKSIAKGYGMEVDDSMTGAQLSDLIPIAEKAYTAEENRASRLDVANIRQQTLNDSRTDRQTAIADKKDEKAQKDIDDRFTKARIGLDSAKGRAGQYGEYRKTLDSTDRLAALARNDDGTPKNLTLIQLQELAIGVNKALGGSDAAGQIEHLVPKNALTSETALKDWLTSNPHGANQQEFIKQNLEMLDRQRAVAKAQLKQAAIVKARTYGDLEQKAPDKFAEMLAQNDITPDEYKKGINIDEEVKRSMASPGSAGKSVTSSGRPIYAAGGGIQ